MRLYHSTILTFFISGFLCACTPVAETTEASINGKILVDGQVYEVQQVPGSTVQEALDSAELEVDELDAVEPPSNTVLSDGFEVLITRVREEFMVEQIEIPFDQKRLPTELLPEGVERYDPLQKGKAGLREITYRIVYEDGVEVSRTQIKSSVIEEPQTQIILFGTQPKHSPIDIPGKLFYISQGNAVMFDGNTASRIPVVNSGDLDGRVLTLSDNGEWLLFTRRSEEEGVINTLWAVQLTNTDLEIDLQVENIIHFADWAPGLTNRVLFSTVESRQAAPGWQANNNLLARDFSLSGWVNSPDTLVDTNSGGVYGWWGTDFVFSPGKGSLAYAGPDQIGLLNSDFIDQGLLLEITPFQTRSDWAWVPGVNWSPDGRFLFAVNHAPPPGSISPEESPNFDLVALMIDKPEPLVLVSQVGMFAYPLPSPIQEGPSGEDAYQVAYLQAIFPDQSDTSRYRLMVMDRDGSNKQEIFPSKDDPGIEPNKNWGQWSPAPLEVTGNHVIAALYLGDIWLIDPITGDTWQVTGDGSIDRLIWRE
jgi:hypothetical protein